MREDRKNRLVTWHSDRATHATDYQPLVQPNRLQQQALPGLRDRKANLGDLEFQFRQRQLHFRRFAG